MNIAKMYWITRGAKAFVGRQPILISRSVGQETFLSGGGVLSARHHVDTWRVGNLLENMKIEILDKIEMYFGAVPGPNPDEVLAERYRESEDAGLMLADFCGKHWRDLPASMLFRHREMLPALSAVGYRGYIAAYLRASVLDGPYDADLREYTLFSLIPIDSHRVDEREVRQRLSLLNRDQRDTIEAYVRYLSDERQMSQARRVLDELFSKVRRT